MAKNNFKSFSDFGRNLTDLVQNLMLLDTGAFSDFFRTSALLESMRSNIQQGAAPEIRDANWIPPQIDGSFFFASESVHF